MKPIFRQFKVAGVVVAVCLLAVVADGRTADAQGLLRRIQERVRSRIAPVLEAPTPASQPATTPNLQPLWPQRIESPTNTEANPFGNSVLSPDQADRPVAPTLGVSVVEANEGIAGLRIASVRADSLADEAGLITGDLIIAIEGKPTPSIATVVDLLASRKVGDRVRVTVIRQRRTETITVPLVDPVVASAKPAMAPAANARPAVDTVGETTDFGVTIERPRGARGLIVTKVTSESPAAAAGLQVGDRIVSVDGRLVLNAESFAARLAARQPTETLALQLVRDGKLVVVEIGSNNTTGGESAISANGDSSSGAGSVLEGFGSVLGGLLGGDAGRQPASNGDGKAKTSGADTPVTQAGFESVRGNAVPKLKTDPPSLEGLKLPPRMELRAPESAPTNAEQIDALREQIRQLEAQLKELEAKD